MRASHEGEADGYLDPADQRPGPVAQNPQESLESGRIQQYTAHVVLSA